ncbi:hypothetical protein CcCBS67573_g09386 [Chytriomyces confervae]|uniref:Solute carrier family 40 member n=1 Tax=Chytriomyces confervae TaxID=246404 RepID=A0A507DY72_9FUNG|nr:hypothetical protein CcCBS67573_g09386 [Chytriomyces confervae]
MDEWAVTLMISAIYPSSLAHISAYSLIITGVSILFGSHVGRFAVSWSESRSRLKIVVASIVVQKVSIAVSAGLLLRLFFMDLEDKTGSLLFFAAVTAAGAAQRLAHRASVIAVEKDWAVVLVRGDALLQTVLNAYLRRVDLVCKLAAPLFVSLVAIPLSVPWTMLVVTAVSLASIPIEILLIRLVFFSSIDLQSHVKESVSAESIVKSGTDELVPLEIYPESQAPNDGSFREHDADAQISAITLTEMNAKKSAEAASENEGHSKMSTVSNAAQPELPPPIQDEIRPSEASIELPSNSATISKPEAIAKPSFYSSWKIYFTHKIFLASFSVCLLYFTSLSFAGVMTTYLLAESYSPTFLAVMRSLCVLSGLSATFIAPHLIQRIGLIRTGLASVWFQLAFLFLALIALIPNLILSRALQGTLFFGGMVFSRLGLWSMDLCEMQILQQHVEEEFVGAINGVEFSLQNVFELLSYVLTLVWTRPDEFWISGVFSVGAVLLSAVCFSLFAARFGVRD